MSVDTREPVVDDGDIGPRTRNGHLIPRLAARWASGGCRVYARVPPSSTNPATAAATANNVRVCEVSGRVCCGAAGPGPAPPKPRVATTHLHKGVRARDGISRALAAQMFLLQETRLLLCARFGSVAEPTRR
jgi:hypothetical protein